MPNPYDDFDRNALIQTRDHAKALFRSHMATHEVGDTKNTDLITAMNDLYVACNRVIKAQSS